MSYKIISEGINLIKPSLASGTQSGVTYTRNIDGSYTLNGTITAEYIVLGLYTLPANYKGTFRLVGCPSGGSTYDSYRLTYRNSIDDVGRGVNITDPTKGSIISIIVYRRAGTLNNLVFKPMLTSNVNLTYNDYVPCTPTYRKPSELAMNKYSVTVRYSRQGERVLKPYTRYKFVLKKRTVIEQGTSPNTYNIGVAWQNSAFEAEINVPKYFYNGDNTVIYFYQNGYSYASSLGYVVDIEYELTEVDENNNDKLLIRRID